MKVAKFPTGIILALCFVLFAVVTWTLLLRDGRAMYAIAEFYPAVTPIIKSLEPMLVKYGVNSIPTIAFFVITIVAFLAYFVSLQQKIALKTTLIFAIIFQCIVFFSYPILATDIFSYIYIDRVTTVHEQSVWKTKPMEFANEDRFSRLADWQNVTSVYGGVYHFFSSIASRIGGEDLLASVIAYRVMAWVFGLGTMGLVYLITKHYFSETESWAVRLLFWNPLFVMEVFSSAHNDIMMFFFALLSYFFFLKKKIVFSAIALACAVQIKLIIIVLLPFLVLYFLQQKRMKGSAVFISVFTIINLIVFFFMGIDPISFLQRVSYNVGVYWQGLPGFIHRFYPHERILLSIAFVCMVVGLLWYQWKYKVSPLYTYALCILCYLLFVASAYWNWYVLWAFFVLPCIQSRRLLTALLIFTFTSMLAYPLFWVSLRYNHEHIFWAFFMYACIFLIPLTVFLINKPLPLLRAIPLKKTTDVV